MLRSMTDDVTLRIKWEFIFQELLRKFYRRRRRVVGHPLPTV